MSVSRRVVIDVGHTESEPGAVSPFPPNLSEWEYNSRIAALAHNLIYTADVTVLSRDRGTNGYRDLPGKINAFSPQLILSLHCNAATPTAFGTEMIYHPGSIAGARFATILQNEVSSAMGWLESDTGYRGIKSPIGGRGATLLQQTCAPCVIAEPFFLTNEADCRKGIEHMNDLAEAYARAVNGFFECSNF
ncbi:MAG: N-acetylmuramoyl-L-alanine amidase [Verrucomicrobiales bacterium]|nr:N-acetylmuramoyl-L-alanine amidase [Verrucomicrobiales bacterium]